MNRSASSETPNPRNSETPKLRILVTGGAGFIGSHLVRLLLRRGHEVLNVDKLTYAADLSSLSDVADSPSYRFLLADIADAAAMEAAFDDFAPDAVMHLAAESHVDRSIDDPGDFIRSNIQGTYTLLETARKHWVAGGRIFGTAGSPTLRNAETPIFLHVSTDEVYGSLGTEDPPFTELTPYDPHSPYAASKASSDHLALAWQATYGLPVIVTHSSNNYGPCQFPEKLIPVVISKALRGEPIPVYGTGENIRDWLYVEDHAEALLAVLEKGTPGETYNIGAHHERRNIDLVRLVCRLVDEELEFRSFRSPEARVPKGKVPSPHRKSKTDSSKLRPSTLRFRNSETQKLRDSESLITFVADRPGHDLRYAINADKIRTELGWTPRQDPESGLRKTVRWYLGGG